MRGVRVAITLLLFTVAACGSGGGTQPSADLTGVWEFSYSTRAAQACGPPAPGDLFPGCSGAGELTLTQAGERIDGTAVFRGGCQSCGSAADFFGSSSPVTGQLRGDRLELDTGRCRHEARVPADASEVSGTAACSYEGETGGTWRMTRR